MRTKVEWLSNDVIRIESSHKSHIAGNNIQPTTDKVYKPKDGLLWVESDPLVASGSYAVSNCCSEGWKRVDRRRSIFESKNARGRSIIC